MVEMSIWALKEDHMQPIHDFIQILLKNKRYGNNVRKKIEYLILFLNSSIQIYFY